MPDDSATPGWDAISQALASLYPQQTARHFGAALAWTMGGKDPLDGVSVYWSNQGRPHWHYVSYGLSELFAKESDDPDVSGFGFELTFRLAAAQGATAADDPPTWPMSLLQNLARYVFQTGNILEAGHHLDANGPISLDRATVLRHLAFVLDPQLPPRQTPNGDLQFLQVVGLSEEEIAAIQQTSTHAVLQALEPAMPLWITDLDRGSLLADPGVVARLEQAHPAESESHGTDTLLVETLEWHQADEAAALTLVLGAGQVGRLLQLLSVQLGNGRPFTVTSGPRQWTFQLGDEDQLREEGMQALSTLSPASLLTLQQTLTPVRGTYPVSDLLTVEVRPSALRDSQGRVVRWIGEDATD